MFEAYQKACHSSWRPWGHAYGFGQRGRSFLVDIVPEQFALVRAMLPDESQGELSRKRLLSG